MCPQCSLRAGGTVWTVWTPTPKEPLNADAQAEADSGDDEAPLDEESESERRWRRRLFSQRVLSPLSSESPQASLGLGDSVGEQVEGSNRLTVCTVYVCTATAIVTGILH